jgi:hypothetical protein
VDGMLAVSRAFGDLRFSSIFPEPEVERFELAGDEHGLLLACDGLFETLNPFLIHQTMQILPDKSSQNICQSLVEKAFVRGSMDNITSIFVPIKAKYRFLKEKEKVSERKENTETTLCGMKASSSVVVQELELVMSQLKNTAGSENDLLSNKIPSTVNEQTDKTASASQLSKAKIPKMTVAEIRLKFPHLPLSLSENSLYAMAEAEIVEESVPKPQLASETSTVASSAASTASRTTSATSPNTGRRRGQSASLMSEKQPKLSSPLTSATIPRQRAGTTGRPLSELRTEEDRAFMELQALISVTKSLQTNK